MRPLGFLLLCIIIALQLQLASSWPLPRKPGCPKPSSYSECQYVRSQCADDTQCGSSQRCCDNGCRMLCIASGMLANLYNPMNYAVNGPLGK